MYQQGDVHQIALVLLNKGDAPTRFDITGMQAGEWASAFDGHRRRIDETGAASIMVGAHGVEVLLLDAPVAAPVLRALSR